jgi:hypothetical protein
MAASDSGEHSLKLRIEIENCLSTLQQNLLISGNNIMHLAFATVYTLS